MAKVTWQGGRNMSDAQRGVREAQKALLYGATEALGKSVEEGAVATQDYLEAAVTTTGLAREATGAGLPGRHDTGNMVGSVSHDGDHPKRSGKIVSAAWGWFRGEFEEYIRDQDLGEGNIPAARALPQSFVLARENFRRRLKSLMRGGSVE